MSNLVMGTVLLTHFLICPHCTGHDITIVNNTTYVYNSRALRPAHKQTLA